MSWAEKSGLVEGGSKRTLENSGGRQMGLYAISSALYSLCGLG